MKIVQILIFNFSGVKRVSDTDDVLLQVPARNIQISLLSDDSFTEVIHYVYV